MTWPWKHSIPNQEQGPNSPSIVLFQLDRAPNGSFSTLSRNRNNATPVSNITFYQQLHFLLKTKKTRKNQTEVKIFMPSELRDQHELKFS